MNEKKTGALILSGGKSRRMGQDKTTLQYNGESFLERAAGFWKAVPGISAVYLGIGSEEHLAKVRKDPAADALIAEGTVRPVLDLYTGCGPMAGIHAAFQAGDEDWLYVSAIDIPNMNASILPEVSEPEADAYVYIHEGKAEPLFALYSRRVFQVMEQMLAEGRYKLYDLLKQVNTCFIPLKEGELRYFYNCNTPEDLSRIPDNR